MDGIKLKPCPFCGCDAEMQREWNSYYGLDTFYVQCTGCYAQTTYDFDLEDVAHLWNERAGTDD